MGKIYARQVNPEYQKSPLFQDELFFPEDIAVTGNRGFRSKTFYEFDLVVSRLEEAAEEYRYNSAKIEMAPEELDDPDVIPLPEILKDYELNKHSGEAWTEEELKTWVAILKADEAPYTNEKDAICAALSLIMGKAYGYTMIRGSAQGDWNYMYYPIDEWDGKGLDTFECEYFNTGSEWLVCDGSFGAFDPESEDPEYMDGFYAYTAEYGENGVKAWIADLVGANPEDVVLYVWDGVVTTNKYRKA